MAYAQNDLTQSGLGRFKARFETLRAAYSAHRARRAIYLRTVDELHALNDRELADLGFHRSEIPRLARQAAAEM
ncbi:protein of unknown function [Roseivivax lentus]|uniref:YjiS-like domain-containing protein n=1 Tax=Roseivivax lentus TaxID=633194 RepID=A0A1N7NGV0_9RHOB|nr:DUF1127 domain-containing protein [Roseivivax lentus]SIS97537.1 protein of unknown function [Roseivivax lentus]